MRTTYDVHDSTRTCSVYVRTGIMTSFLAPQTIFAQSSDEVEGVPTGNVVNSN
jgi:hypothetical protein